MGDGIIRKYAVIINADTEDRHLENVKKAVSVLKDSGYRSFLLNPNVVPDAEHYGEFTVDILKRLSAGIKSDDDDQLVIYLTGHGMETADGDTVSGGVPNKVIHGILNGLSYGTRTVIMDQCFSGNGAELWYAPKSLFISPDWKGSKTACQFFAPYFWADEGDIKDLNGDGNISFQERFAHASAVYTANLEGEGGALPSFLPASDYKDIGSPPFPKGVVEVASKDELDERLKGLRSGQYAIVAFSAPWCGPCKEYIPEFRKTAESSGGRFLFILVENEEIDWMKECGVTGVPTVRIFDHLKRAVTVDKNEPFDGILELSLSVEAVFELGRSKLEAGDKEGLKLILKAAGSAPSLAMSKDLKAFVRAFDDKDLLTSVLGARGIVALRERLDIFPSMDEGAMLVTKAEEYLNNMEESYGELEYSEMSYEINRDEKVILEHLERAIELFPKNISAHLLKFDTLQRLGRHKEALAGSERVIELNEDDYMGYYLKSLALTGLEEYPMAIVYTRRALDKQPADKAHISHLHQVIGNAKRHMGDMNGAKKSFLTAIDNDPMALDYMNLAGVLVVPDFVQFGARTFKEAGAEANAVWAFNFGKIGLGPKLGAGYAHDTVYAGQTFDLTGGAAVFYKGNDLLIGADAGIGRSFSLVEDERHSPAINGWFYDYGVYSFISAGCPCLRLGIKLSIQQDISDNELAYKVVPGLSAVFW